MVVVVAAMSNPKVRYQQNTWRSGLAAGLVAVVLILCFLSFPSEKNDLELSEEAESVKKEKDRVISADISLKTVGEIPYYHCTGTGSDGEGLSLVLLHGAKFTKEDWKTSGILEDFCKREAQKTIDFFAVDLSVQADYKDLMNFLDSVPDISKPVSLVTPSASGKTMVSWVASTTVHETLPRYIRQWIPVAAVAVNLAPDDDLRKFSDIPILAVYGDADKSGKASSEKLQSLAGAQILEQVGRHPCYLDSPKEFVVEVSKFVESS